MKKRVKLDPREFCTIICDYKCANCNAIITKHDNFCPMCGENIQDVDVSLFLKCKKEDLA